MRGVLDPVEAAILDHVAAHGRDHRGQVSAGMASRPTRPSACSRGWSRAVSSFAGARAGSAIMRAPKERAVAQSWATARFHRSTARFRAQQDTRRGRKKPGKGRGPMIPKDCKRLVRRGSPRRGERKRRWHLSAATYRRLGEKPRMCTPARFRAGAAGADGASVRRKHGSIGRGEVAGSAG